MKVLLPSAGALGWLAEISNGPTTWESQDGDHCACAAKRAAVSGGALAFGCCEAALGAGVSGRSMTAKV